MATPVVWLPLNGDLKNIGTGTLEKRSGTDTYRTDAKTGANCFDLSSAVTFYSAEFANTSNTGFTVCFWMKVDSSTTLTGNWVHLCTFTDAKSGQNNGTFRFEACYASSLRACSWHDNPNYNVISSAAKNAVLMVADSEKNKWHHCCVTMGEDKVCSYVDGTLINDTARINSGGYFTGVFSLGQTSAISGGMNDFRIYNTTLSQKEVKEIAQGLILHYKLDGMSGGVGDNLLLNSNFVNGTTSWTSWAYATSREIISSGNKKWVHMVNTANNYGGYSQVIEVKPGTKYTVSGTFYASENITAIFWWHWRSTDGGANISQSNKTLAVTTTPQRFTYTISGYTHNTYTINRLNFMVGAYSSNTTGGIHLYFTDLKIEEGDLATAWSPAPAEIGLDSNRIIDSSGYGNDGEIFQYDTLGNIINISDSPRYQSSTHIISENNTTNTASGSIYIYGHCGLTNPTTMTVAFWCKPIAGYGGGTTQGQFCTTTYAMGNNAGSDYQGSAMNHRDGAIDINDSASTTQIRPTIGFIVNEWHHYAITYDGQTGKTYRDGVELSSKSFDAAKTLDSFIGVIIGFSKAGGVWRSNDSYYSDFRVYATALVEEDIKKLYNTGMSIDNLQRLHAYEFVENEITNPRFYKNGIVEVKEFIEQDNTSSNYTDKIIMDELIEI